MRGGAQEKGRIFLILPTTQVFPTRVILPERLNRSKALPLECFAILFKTFKIDSRYCNSKTEFS